mgnify:CR=1 FL=1
MDNLISWFEIPVSDFNRAKTFYAAILEAEIQEMEIAGTLMGMFPTDGQNVSGAIIQGDDYKPTSDGCLVYLNARNNIPAFLERVEKAGGTVIVPKTEISPEFGYFAIFIDSEGNKLALHSPQ